MSEVAQVVRNVAYQAAARLVLLALSVVTLALLTRHLGPAGFGTVVTVVVVLQLFAPMADPGVSVLLATEGAAEPQRLPALAAAARRLARLSVLPVTAAAVTTVFVLFRDPGLRTGVVLASVGLAVTVLQPQWTGALQAQGRLGPASLGEAAGRVAYLCGVLLVVLLGGDATIVLALGVLPPLVLLAVTRTAARSALPPVLPVVTRSDVRALARRALPLGLSTLLFSVYFRLDTLLLAVLRGAEEVGAYGAAYRIVEVLLVLPSFLTAALLPVLARARAVDLARTRRIAGQSAGNLAVLGLGLAVAGPFLAAPLLALTAGAAYSQAAPALAVLLVGVGASFLTALWGTLLIVLSEAGFLLRFSCLNVAVNLALNLVLVPRIGLTGAAVSTLVTEVLALVFVGRRLQRRHQVRVPMSPVLRGGAACVPLALFLLLSSGVPVVLRAPAAATVFLGAAWGLHALTVPLDLRALLLPGSSRRG